jgi:PST family polysaccharide transporter
VGAELTAKLLQPICLVVLAAILTPADLGVVASAMIIVSFCELIWQAGMGKALVQTTEDIGKAANSAFLVNAVMASIIIIVLLIAAPWLANVLFASNQVANVIRALCVYIALGSLCSVQIFMLQKKMDFKSIFFLRMATSFVPVVFSVSFALLGFRYWAIIIGNISGQVAQLVVLLGWRIYRPSFQVDPVVLKRMFRFGSWVLASGLLTWFYSWVDALVVGIFLDGKELGLYRTGLLLVSYFYGAIFMPVLPVIYSQLSKFHSEGREIQSLLCSAVRIIAMISLPLSCFIFILSPYFETYILGPQWRGIAFITSNLALMVGFSTIVSANGEAYRAIGKPHLEAIVTASLLFVYLAGYLVSIRYGLRLFVYTRLGLAGIALVGHLALAQWVGIINLRKIAPTLFSAAVVGLLSLATFYLQQRLSYLPKAGELLYVVPCVVVAGISLYLLQKRTLKADIEKLAQT